MYVPPHRGRAMLTAAFLLVTAAAPATAQSSHDHGATGTASAVSAQATPADVTFMQGMIGHHAQALVMAALVPARATNPQMTLLAERITVSQRDEIAIMRRWLEERRLPVPEAHEGHPMPGMLSPAQLDTLSRTRGAEFDRLFLRYMIQHHEGALLMVSELLAAPNAARDPMIFQFASDVDTDQRAEIRRMQAMLASMR